MTNLENALIWLYVKTWGKFGDHLIKEKQLWHFSASDLETAIMGLILPRTKEKTDRVQAFTDLIMEKFEQDGTAFYEWVIGIHKEAIETLPETAEQQEQSTSVKILEWDPGRYLGFPINICRQDLAFLICEHKLCLSIEIQCICEEWCFQTDALRCLCSSHECYVHGISN